MDQPSPPKPHVHRDDQEKITVCHMGPSDSSEVCLCPCASHIPIGYLVARYTREVATIIEFEEVLFTNGLNVASYRKAARKLAELRLDDDVPYRYSRMFYVYTVRVRAQGELKRRRLSTGKKREIAAEEIAAAEAARDAMQVA